MNFVVAEKKSGAVPLALPWAPDAGLDGGASELCNPTSQARKPHKPREMGIAERAKHLNLSSGELSVKEKQREEELNSQSADWMAFGLLPHDIDKKRFIVVAEESFQRHITDAEFNDWAVDVLSSRTDVEQKWSQKGGKGARVAGFRAAAR